MASSPGSGSGTPTLTGGRKRPASGGAPGGAAHAQDAALASGYAGRAARMQQAEGVAAAGDLHVRRQRQAG
ncbi:hypothetical protein L2225_22495, partial [Xanthomonas perforans]|uniref:hypothetical protein n=1 Tax=Xanthomonas perforans TaxID=442694 RepID=UPI001F1D2AB8